MKVNKEIFDLSENILNTFDPKRMKQNEILNVEKTKSVSNKWENIEKGIEKQEKLDEINNKDFEKESAEKYHKMMGCNKDHAAEIDIYNKTYKEKISRIKLMKEQGNAAIASYNSAASGSTAQSEEKLSADEYLQKASYYYAQALLIFYYLIPENDEEEKESNALKISCHLNQSLAFMKLKRYDECLQELSNVLYKLDKNNVKALYRKTQVLEIKGNYEEASAIIAQFEKFEKKEAKDEKLFAALKAQIGRKMAENEVKTKALAQKMMQQDMINKKNAKILETEENEKQKSKILETETLKTEDPYAEEIKPEKEQIPVKSQEEIEGLKTKINTFQTLLLTSTKKQAEM